MRFVVRCIAPGTSSVSEEVLVAASADEARARSVADGRIVLAVVAATAPRASAEFDVAWWCRELRTLLCSGMSAVEAIETLADGQHDAQRSAIHAGLLKALREGRSLSRAMRAAGAFPAVLVASVAASERTSTLAEALDDYLRYDEVLQRLRRQAVSAAIYPSVVVALGLLITVFLLLFVVPRFSGIYTDMHGELSLTTQGVLMLSRALQQHTPLLVGIVFCVALVAVWAVRSGAPKRAAARAAEAIEPLRLQLEHFRLAKLYHSLALMFRGGYTLDEALTIGAGLDLGERIAEAVELARGEIARGKSASGALSAAGLTSTVTRRLLAVGERAGNFDAVLQTIADRHAQAFATFVERATRIVEPLLLLLVALMVGGVVVMMYMPIFDIAGSVGGGR